MSIKRDVSSNPAWSKLSPATRKDETLQSFGNSSQRSKDAYLRPQPVAHRLSSDFHVVLAQLAGDLAYAGTAEREDTT
jgi:hypothetical protein